MVKIGFISEGKSDRTILNSERFKKYLEHQFGITYSEEEILYGGGKSRIKTDFKSLIQNLYKKGVEYIFIMVDQDDKEAQRRNRKYKPVDCPMIVVNEITGYRDNGHYLKDNQIFIIMTKEMEAWFLADEKLNFDCGGQRPEEILNPSDLVGKQLGTSSHGRIAHKLKDKFSLARAAENAPSARRFLNKLEQISQQ
ncbi:protein of unknown function [Draconibacterium orientale]|uniref:DUF4276 family protein n=1 Tax=Draconibacterium orientale TaxID=1168034 RepID=X5DJX0_9BACT|nr:DUF4276 family protein [Draconibacterium orientale]AHW61449.1 hypothetical protein FH5T_01310 [Draconibacterium orientale]SET12513.1 protein of unknown function [Draconibacterium orientale]